ncbi:hypothetical protein [Streptomyces sp. NPDC002676]
MLGRTAVQGGAAAGAGGLTVGHSARIRAEGGSIAAGVVQGGVQPGLPPLLQL